MISPRAARTDEFPPGRILAPGRNFAATYRRAPRGTRRGNKTGSETGSESGGVRPGRLIQPPHPSSPPPPGQLLELWTDRHGAFCSCVMAGLGPATHDLRCALPAKAVGSRAKPGHDTAKVEARPPSS